MCSGFSTTGASDDEVQADQAECGCMARAILAAVEQRPVGAGVLSARGDQRESIPALEDRELPVVNASHGTAGYFQARLSSSSRAATIN